MRPGTAMPGAGAIGDMTAGEGGGRIGDTANKNLDDAYKAIFA